MIKSTEECSKVEVKITKKLTNLDVAVKSLKSKVDSLVKYDKSLVEFSPPINLRRIWGWRMGLDNCNVIEANF